MIRAGAFILLVFAIGLLIIQGFTEDVMNEKIDLQSLEFVCIKEQKPVSGKEVDDWFNMARAIEKGERSGTDEQVLKLYENAVAKNHFKAIHSLARIYVSGSIVNVDHKRAVKLTELGIKLESAAAYFTMGIYLEDGIGVKPDKSAAFVYYRKSADMGYPPGQYVVGQLLLSGDYDGIEEKDEIIGIGLQMLECSLEQNFAEAGRLLGHYYSVLDEASGRGLVYYQKAAALGDSASLYALVTAFEEGVDGAPKDEKRADCYTKLWEELEEDESKRFPDIDRICPLPESFKQF
jgi:uncharacterized protein